jgi:ABC-2 type transport system ATP-binding protein
VFSTNDPIIATRALTRDFGRVPAVDRLTLDVPPAVVFGFPGPTGSGNTTTVRLRLGLLESTAGNARGLGHDVRSGAGRVREGSGALLEHPGLYQRVSAQDNLDFYGRGWRMGTTERRARIEQLLKPLGLWDRRRDLVGGWSRGMKQKLAVARAMLHRSRPILDRPPVAQPSRRAPRRSRLAAAT